MTLVTIFATGCADDKPPLVRAELTITEQPLFPAEIVDDELIIVVGTAPIVEIRVFDDTGAERRDESGLWTSEGPVAIHRLATEVTAGREGLSGQFVVLGAEIGGTQLVGSDDLLVNVEVREQVWPPEDPP